MENLNKIKEEFENQFTLGSYEKHIWEFFEEKIKDILQEREGKINSKA